MPTPDSTTTTEATSSATGTTLTATASTTTKPGYKTTEFYLSLAAALVGALLTSGLLADGSQAMRIAGMAAFALATLGYTVSRGAAKRGGSALVLIFALAIAPTSSGCAAAQDSAKRVAGDVVNCMKPEAKGMIGELVPTFLAIFQNATGNDGKIDWQPVRATASSLKSPLTRCAFSAAVAEVLRPKQKDPNAPQSSELEADPADVALGFEKIRAEFYGGAKFDLETGRL